MEYIREFFLDMIRRLFNTLVENIVNQPEPIHFPSPFNRPETQNLNWLLATAPCFPVRVDCISILTEPCEFYDVILKGCREARRRITLASLYLGNGGLEQKIVDCIRDNPEFERGNLRVDVLIDFTRGSRGVVNSRALLRGLLEKNEGGCEVSLYHTPVLRGITKRIVPDRWNELFGLQHMKLYIFDDTLVISGANLSNDYFTNRQDRYYVIKDKKLTDFYCGLVKNVQSFSLQLDKNDNVRLQNGWKHSPYQGSRIAFVEEARNLVRNFIWDAKDEQNINKQSGYDTWVFPLVQMGQLRIEQDAFVTERLLARAQKNSRLFIATGYFNLTNRYMETIINKSEAACHLLMAHPDANGFQGAKGAAGGIPAAYCLIADRFRRKIESAQQTHRITLREFLKTGWTYHAKGLWYYPAESGELPTVTLIGSPNFGERSVRRDLETQLAVVTENAELRRRMHDECRRLFEHALPVEKDRVIPAWVQAMVALFRDYF